MLENQSIAFAFYKGNTLIGYRLDSMGSVGMGGAKIYTYSKEQVNTVLKNIDYVVKNGSGIGKAIGSEELSDIEDAIHKEMQDQRAFEVRVVKAPDRYTMEKEFDIQKAEYVDRLVFIDNQEEMKEWLEHPEQHEVIETHYFSVIGKLSEQ